MELTSGEPQKREVQVLVLAAGGMTDKEIALRLGISPDTVGTYWRRILAKYQASSRTEVVAKYSEERSREAMESLRYVNECLKLVADHMIENAVGKPVDTMATPSDTILASLSDWILLTDLDGHVIFSNRPVAQGLSLSDLFVPSGDVELSEILTEGASSGASIEVVTGTKAPEQIKGRYEARLSPCIGDGIGRVVFSARRLSESTFI